MIRIFALLFASILSLSSLAPTDAYAAQNVRAAPDGSIGFNISTAAVTRLSVRGDRIRRIVLDDSAFEMTNDAETGDVFFRVIRATTSSENGYIITEAGHTIGFTLQPTRSVVEPVIITLTGVPTAAAASPAAAAAVPIGSADIGIGGGFVDDVASSMTAIIREVASAHVVGRAVPSGQNNKLIRTETGPGWRAEVRLATAGTQGRLVREQDFYGSGVQAVWVLQSSLPANGRTFVVVVKKR